MSWRSWSSFTTAGNLTPTISIASDLDGSDDLDHAADELLQWERDRAQHAEVRLLYDNQRAGNSRMVLIRRAIDSHFRRQMSLVIDPELVAFAFDNTIDYRNMLMEDRARLNRLREEIQSIQFAIATGVARRERNASNQSMCPVCYIRSECIGIIKIMLTSKTVF